MMSEPYSVRGELEGSQHENSASRRGQRSTSRKAWHEVRDYTQREVDARQAMVGALKEDVVGRLVAVKVRSRMARSQACKLNEGHRKRRVVSDRGYGRI